MKLEDVIDTEELEEAAKRQFKRVGNKIRKRYRCQGGPKNGKLVSEPGNAPPAKIQRKSVRAVKSCVRRKA